MLIKFVADKHSILFFHIDEGKKFYIIDNAPSRNTVAPFLKNKKKYFFPIKIVFVLFIMKWKLYLLACVIFCVLLHFINLHFVNMLFYRLIISSTCHFINLPKRQLAVSSSCHFVNLPFHQLAISTTILRATYPITFLSPN